MSKKLMYIFGTRPEAIKMAPVIKETLSCKEFENIICVTAQHRKMLDQVLSLFDIKPDIDLNIMKPNQTLAQITSKVMLKLDSIVKEIKPDIVLIQGDTTTVMSASMVAFYNRIPVAHVEAGLRSFNIYSPFPEEFNRRVVSLVTKFHFTPTENAKLRLIQEGVSEKNIYVTGNTVIDSLFLILKKTRPRKVDEILHSVNGNKKLILVTAHRRENFGERFVNICNGLKKLVERNKDIVIVYPVHLNPNVQLPVNRILKNVERIILIEPVEYDVLVHLMKESYLILTDSGGIQEEAPSLGKPVLVLRDETERPEGVESGVAKVIGPYEDKIVDETEKLLRNKNEYEKMAKAVNPYGDGMAAVRIVEILKKSLISKN